MLYVCYYDSRILLLASWCAYIMAARWLTSGADPSSCHVHCAYVSMMQCSILSIWHQILATFFLHPSTCRHGETSSVDVCTLRKRCMALFMPHDRMFILVFWHKEWLVGDDYVTVVDDRPMVSANIVWGQLHLAKTAPCSSRMVSLQQLSFLFCFSFIT